MNAYENIRAFDLSHSLAFIHIDCLMQLSTVYMCWPNEWAVCIMRYLFLSVKSNTTNDFTVSLALVSEPFISYTLHKNTHKRIFCLSNQSKIKITLFVFPFIFFHLLLFHKSKQVNSFLFSDELILLNFRSFTIYTHLQRVHRNSIHSKRLKYIDKFVCKTQFQ